MIITRTEEQLKRDEKFIKEYLAARGWKLKNLPFVEDAMAAAIEYARQEYENK